MKRQYIKILEKNQLDNILINNIHIDKYYNHAILTIKTDSYLTDNEDKLKYYIDFVLYNINSLRKPINNL